MLYNNTVFGKNFVGILKTASAEIICSPSQIYSTLSKDGFDKEIETSSAINGKAWGISILS